MPRVAQWRSLALLHYRLDDPRAIPWTHAYARRDAFDEYRLSRTAGFSSAAVGAWPRSWRRTGWSRSRAGPCAGYELRSPGPAQHAGCCAPARCDRFGSLDAFAAAMQCGLAAGRARRADPLPRSGAWRRGVRLVGRVSPSLAGIAGTTCSRPTPSLRSTTAARSICARSPPVSPDSTEPAPACLGARPSSLSAGSGAGWRAPGRRRPASRSCRAARRSRCRRPRCRSWCRRHRARCRPRRR